MKELLELLALQGGKVVCSASLTSEEINKAREENRMRVDENGIGFVHVGEEPDYRQKLEEAVKLLEESKSRVWYWQAMYQKKNDDPVIGKIEQFIQENKGV